MRKEVSKKFKQVSKKFLRFRRVCVCGYIHVRPFSLDVDLNQGVVFFVFCFDYSGTVIKMLWSEFNSII
jgi:hypothetical protein